MSFWAVCFSFLFDLSFDLSVMEASAVVAVLALAPLLEYELVLGAAAVVLELTEPEADGVFDTEPLEPWNEAVLPIDVVVAPLLPELEVAGAWAEAAGAGVLAEVPGCVELLEAGCEEVVDSADFFLFMSPRARALPLASATIEVRIKAGASLRI